MPDCARCGRCCTVRFPDGRTGRCEFLRGRGGDTACAVHGVRRDGMRVTICVDDGTRIPSRCVTGMAEDVMGKLRGCPVQGAAA